MYSVIIRWNSIRKRKFTNHRSVLISKIAKKYYLVDAIYIFFRTLAIIKTATTLSRPLKENRLHSWLLDTSTSSSKRLLALMHLTRCILGNKPWFWFLSCVLLSVRPCEQYYFNTHVDLVAHLGQIPNKPGQDIWLGLKIVQTIDWSNAAIPDSPWLFLKFLFFQYHVHYPVHGVQLQLCLLIDCYIWYSRRLSTI